MPCEFRLSFIGGQKMHCHYQFFCSPSVLYPIKSSLLGGSCYICASIHCVVQSTFHCVYTTILIHFLSIWHAVLLPRLLVFDSLTIFILVPKEECWCVGMLLSNKTGCPSSVSQKPLQWAVGSPPQRVMHHRNLNKRTRWGFVLLEGNR